MELSSDEDTRFEFSPGYAARPTTKVGVADPDPVSRAHAQECLTVASTRPGGCRQTPARIELQHEQANGFDPADRHRLVLSEAADRSLFDSGVAKSRA